MREDRIVALSFIGMLVVILSFAKYLDYDYKRPRDVTQIQLDTLYNILVGPDSSSILNTVTRIQNKLDSICTLKPEGQC